jgi:hypothetical protein
LRRRIRPVPARSARDAHPADGRRRGHPATRCLPTACRGRGNPIRSTSDFLSARRYDTGHLRLRAARSRARLRDGPARRRPRTGDRRRSRADGAHRRRGDAGRSDGLLARRARSFIDRATDDRRHRSRPPSASSRRSRWRSRHRARRDATDQRLRRSGRNVCHAAPAGRALGPAAVDIAARRAPMAR